MTLGFTQKINGKSNYFIEKIWAGLTYTGSPYIHKPLMEISLTVYNNNHIEKFGKQWNMPDQPVQPKRHTIRHDPSNRWRPGMDIHFVINNRTKDRFQFAPVVKCQSVQPIKIEWVNGTAWVTIGHRSFTTFRKTDAGMEYGENAKELAINNGFDSVEDFFSYFNKDFKGKIIHWTDLKY